MQSPSDFSGLSKRVFMATGPSRIAAFALLSCHDAVDERGDVIAKRMEQSRERVHAALSMLETEVDALFRERGADPPPELETLRTAAIKALRALETSTDGAENRRGAEDSRETARLLSQVIAPEVETTVSAYLAALEKWTASRDAEDAARKIEDMTTSVHEIQAISRTIHLISINASIEASRAGAAGRGFGVIATEIQALAGRAQSSLAKLTLT